MQEITAAKVFEEQRSIYLSDVLPAEKSKELTQHMFDLYEKGKTTRDEQCPLSEAIYGDPVFDKLLEDLTKPLSEQLGIELLPAYTYARLYRPGDELKIHKDRPSCEISGTITLGHDPDSRIWPIYFGKPGDDKDPGMPIEIGVGDLVMYRGNELNHWRPVYKGKWQVQVFVHYVDANGPHKEWAYDKREKLGTLKGNENVDQNKVQHTPNNDDNVIRVSDLNHHIIHNGVMINTTDGHFPGACTYHSKFYPEFMFTEEECAKVIALADNDYGQKARIGAGYGPGSYNENVRQVDQYHIDLKPDTAWIFNKIADAVGKANSEWFKFNLQGITHSLQLLHYKASDKSHYDWHMDVGPGDSSTRKISVSVPLSPRDSYEGGDLEINNIGVPMTAIADQGAISMFPSFLMHRVSPVTKGERWVIVIWVHGNDRFK